MNPIMFNLKVVNFVSISLFLMISLRIDASVFGYGEYDHRKPFQSKLNILEKLNAIKSHSEGDNVGKKRTNLKSVG